MIVLVINNSDIQLHTIIRDAGAQVWNGVKEIPPFVIERSSLSVVEAVDAVVMEVTQHNQELHYILAQAMILEKPVLCLYPRNKQPREILAHLAKKNVPKSIVSKAYTRHSLEEVLHHFLNQLDSKISLDETLNVKFTLRLTPRMEKYIQWLAEQQGLNKAEYLRQVIQERLEHDEEYKKQ